MVPPLDDQARHEIRCECECECDSTRRLTIVDLRRLSLQTDIRHVRHRAHTRIPHKRTRCQEYRKRQPQRQWRRRWRSGALRLGSHPRRAQLEPSGAAVSAAARSGCAAVHGTRPRAWHIGHRHHRCHRRRCRADGRRAAPASQCIATAQHDSTARHSTAQQSRAWLQLDAFGARCAGTARAIAPHGSLGRRALTWPHLLSFPHRTCAALSVLISLSRRVRHPHRLCSRCKHAMAAATRSAGTASSTHWSTRD